MVMATSLTSIVLVAGTRMFSFSLAETAKAQTKTALGLQAADLFTRIGEEVATSMFCEIRSIGGVNALVCGKPDLSNSLNGDSWPDEWLPSTVLSEGQTRFRPGRFTWIYQSDSEGQPGAAASIFVSRLGTQTDEFDLNMSLFDRKFVDNPSRTGTQSPWPSLQSISFSSNPLTRAVTVTVVLSARIGSSQASSTTANGSSVMRITESRTFYWRNGR
jgi:hypothetical protein